MKTRIIIFAKAPVAGRVKTRLIPSLGSTGAARLAQHMLRHTVDAALAAGVGTVELCATPHRTDQAWHALELPQALHWSDQGEGDLGERMARAARRSLARGQAVLLIGTDCPALDSHALHAAASALRNHDAVIAPATDGGYVLLGLKRFDPALFANICWSTDTVARETLSRIKELDWQVHQLLTVNDIDVPADLRWIPPAWHDAIADQRAEAPGHTTQPGTAASSASPL